MTFTKLFSYSTCKLKSTTKYCIITIVIIFKMCRT